MDFEAEEAIIDKYVETKDGGKADPLILQLIEEHFVPQGRFEEAQSWRAAMADKALKTAAGKVIKEALADADVEPVFRHPKNRDWSEVSAVGKSKKTNDQQYHYDRTLNYSVMSKVMLDDKDDVEVCRNEWITFVARNAYTGGLDNMGATMETLAMGISDYIEYFLLAGLISSEDEEELEESGPVLQNPLSQAAAGRPDMIDVIKSTYPTMLDANYIANLSGLTAAAGTKSDELVFTDRGVLVMREKMFGSLKGDCSVIDGRTITNIEIGSETHTEHAGFTSTTTDYWILTINTSGYQSYSHWLTLGSNESEVNRNRPVLMEAISAVAAYYPVVEGQSWSSSGGFQTSIGYGFFW